MAYTPISKRGISDEEKEKAYKDVEEATENSSNYTPISERDEPEVGNWLTPLEGAVTGRKPSDNAISLDKINQSSSLSGRSSTYTPVSERGLSPQESFSRTLTDEIRTKWSEEDIKKSPLVELEDPESKHSEKVRNTPGLVMRAATEDEIDFMENPPQTYKKDKIYHTALRLALPKATEEKLGLTEKRDANIEESVDIQRKAMREREERITARNDYFAPWTAAKAVRDAVYNLPSDVGAKILTSLGFNETSPLDRGPVEKWIEKQKDQNKEMIRKYKEETPEGAALIPGEVPILPQISVGEVAEGASSLSYTATTWGSGMLASVPWYIAASLEPTPFGEAAVTPYAKTTQMAVTGAVAYRLSSSRIESTFLELKNEQKKQETGKELTPKEVEELKDEFSAKSRNHGLAEAIPEAAGSRIGIDALKGKLTKMFSEHVAADILARTGLTYAEELVQETTTEMLQQNNLENTPLGSGKEISLTDPVDWYNSMHSVAPQTFVMVTLMAGSGGGAKSTNKAIQSLKNEIGKDHPQFENLKTSIKERLKPLAEGHVGLTIKDVSRGNMDDNKREAMKEDAGFQKYLGKRNMDMKSLDNNELADIYREFREELEYTPPEPNELTSGAKELIEEVRNVDWASESLEENPYDFQTYRDAVYNDQGLNQMAHDIAERNRIQGVDEMESIIDPVMDEVRNELERQEKQGQQAQREQLEDKGELYHVKDAIRGQSWEDAKQTITEMTPSGDYMQDSPEISDEVAQEAFNRLYRTTQQPGYTDLSAIERSTGGIKRLTDINPEVDGKSESEAYKEKYFLNRYYDEGADKRFEEGEKIKVYRGVPTPKAELRPGDYVTPDRRTAQSFKRSRFGTVLTNEIPAEDLIVANLGGMGGAEFIYYPQGADLEAKEGVEPDKTFEEFYNEAQEEEPTGIEEGPKFMTQEQQRSFEGYNDVTTKVLNKLEQQGIKTASKETYSNLAKNNVKKQEQRLVNEVLDEYNDDADIPAQEFAEKIKSKLLSIEMIDTASYSTYGLNNIGLEGEDATTHLWNTPFKHGLTGHFNGDFQRITENDVSVREIPEKGYWAVVDKNEELTRENVESNVYHVARSEQEAKDWIDEHVGELGKGKARSGLLGHTRSFMVSSNIRSRNVYGDLAYHISEIQSDTFSAQDELFNQLQYTEEAVEAAEYRLNITKEAKNNYYELANVSERMKDSLTNLRENVLEIEDSAIALRELARERIEANGDNFWIQFISNKENFEYNPHGVPIVLNQTGWEKLENEFDFDYKDLSEKLQKYESSARRKPFTSNFKYSLENQLTGARSQFKYNEASALPELEDLESSLIHARNESLEVRADNDSKVKEQEEKLQEIKQKVKNKPSPEKYNQEKQFVNLRNRWYEPLIQKEIKHARENTDATKFRLPTPETVAIIEGYIDTNQQVGANYTVIEGNAEGGLEAGDLINENGTDKRVLRTTQNEIRVADVNDTYQHSALEIAQDNRDSELNMFMRSKRQIENIVQQDMGEGWEIETIGDLKKAIRKMSDIKDDYMVTLDRATKDFLDLFSAPYADVMKDTEIDESESFKNREDLSELFGGVVDDWVADQVKEDPYSYIPRAVFYEVEEGVYIVASTQNIETRQQSSNIKTKDKEFDIDEDIDKEGWKKILKFYQNAVIPYFQKIRKGRVEKVTDERGNTWWETDLDPKDRVNPVAMYRGGFNHAVFNIDKQASIEIAKKFFPEGDLEFIFEDQITTPRGNTAFGRYYKSLVQLVEKGGKVNDLTVYHESFHHYINQYKTQQEQQDLLEAASEQWGIDISTKEGRIRAEEKLAEEFAHWQRTRQEASYIERIKAFFEEMLNRIKGWIGQQDEVLAAFEELSKGISTEQAAESSQEQAMFREQDEASESEEGTVGEGTLSQARKYGKGEEPSEFIRKRETTLLKNKIKSQRTGARLAERMTRKKIKERLDKLKEAINESDLPAKDKAKLRFKPSQLAKVKNKETFENLMDKTLDQIRRLEQSNEYREAVDKVEKVIKKTKPNTQSGKKVSDLGARVQNVMDGLREIVKMNVGETENLLEEKQEQVNQKEANTDKAPTPEEVLELKALAIRARSDRMTTEDINQFADEIQQMIDDGRTERERSEFNKITNRERKKETVVERLTSGEGIIRGRESFGEERDLQLSTYKKAKKKIKMFFKEFGKSTLANWPNLMEISEFYTEVGEEVMPDLFEIRTNENRVQEHLASFRERWHDAIFSSYDVERSDSDTVTQWRVNKKLMELIKEDINLGEFTNKSGVTKELVMTRDEMIKRWMELQDPSLEASFKHGNKWGDEMYNEVVDAINEELTPADKQFAKKQMDIYRWTWNKVNPTYKRMYGMNLDFNDFYSPVRREGIDIDKESSFGEFMEEQQWRTHGLPGALKSRVPNLNPIARQSSIDAMNRHQQQMAHFVGWGEQIREFYDVFGDAKVREAYKQEFSESLYSVIMNSIEDMAGRSSGKNTPFEGVVNWFRRKFTFGQLALKPQIGIKQVSSVVSAMEKIGEFTGGTGAKGLVEGMLDFFKNPRKNLEELKEESTFIKERKNAIERDISEVLNTEGLKDIKMNPTYKNTMMLAVKEGDSAPIAWGSWAIKKAMQENTDASNDEKVAEYEEWGKNTQQAPQSGRLSAVQRLGPVGKLMTMFMSTPIRYEWKVVNAIKTLFREGGTSMENIKRVARTIFIYQVLLPQLFQMISTLLLPGNDDWEENAKLALLLGPANSYAIGGRVVESVIRTSLGMRTFSAEVPILSIKNEINQLIRALSVDDITMEEVADAIDALSDAGTSFGIPSEQIHNFTGGIIDLFEGNVKQGIARILGWSEWTTNRAFDEESGGEGISPSGESGESGMPSFQDFSGEEEEGEGMPEFQDF